MKLTEQQALQLPADELWAACTKDSSLLTPAVKRRLLESLPGGGMKITIEAGTVPAAVAAFGDVATLIAIMQDNLLVSATRRIGVGQTSYKDVAGSWDGSNYEVKVTFGEVAHE
ncbi:hypothetical protein [Anatilimnocola floriformis]|uniref:hypothetical protein n=1 Tax=Anatilimnocola floriformis TaxID=2948575 RepID=UPI0020C4E245|nr:hypothetical protein [Anatilimnocola floriformis]